MADRDVKIVPHRSFWHSIVLHQDDATGVNVRIGEVIDSLESRRGYAYSMRADRRYSLAYRTQLLPRTSMMYFMMLIIRPQLGSKEIQCYVKQRH